MTYREPASPIAPPSEEISRLPRPPMTKSAYWTTYTVLLVVPLLVGIALQVEAAVSAGALMWLAAIFYLWGIGGMAGWKIYARRVGVAWATANTQATRLIGEGEPEKAIVILDELVAKSRAFPVAYSLYLWNRAVAATRSGRFDDARTMLLGVHATKWFERPIFKNFVPGVMISLGTVEALAGNLDEAESWQRRAHGRLTSASGIAALPLDVVIAARRGKLDEAEALCQSHWAAAEAALLARDVKLLRVLRAFVASRRAPEHHASVDAWLAGAKPMRAGAFAYVGAAWPEFAEFERAALQGGAS